MVCPNCRSARLVEIAMNLSAHRVTLHSCPSCEGRWWDREGETIGLRSVLDLVAAR
ncbi:MAG: zf-TFIIB domain-containing protein [Actinomycetota bacterium]|nr:zf-TFIIB domain-containing protein [Actinomycetota bacterium]